MGLKGFSSDSPKNSAERNTQDVGETVAFSYRVDRRQTLPYKIREELPVIQEYMYDMATLHRKGLAIPEQREHDVGVSQLEWRSSHTTGADLGGVFRIFKTDQEIATSCNQPFE